MCIKSLQPHLLITLEFLRKKYDERNQAPSDPGWAVSTWWLGEGSFSKIREMIQQFLYWYNKKEQLDLGNLGGRMMMTWEKWEIHGVTQSGMDRGWRGGTSGGQVERGQMQKNDFVGTGVCVFKCREKDKQKRFLGWEARALVSGKKEEQWPRLLCPHLQFSFLLLGRNTEDPGFSSVIFLQSVHIKKHLLTFTGARRRQGENKNI